MQTYIIDTFTSSPFSGNPAAVCRIAEGLKDETMLSIAAELNYPVTSFIKDEERNEFSIRYFTPLMEIPACGHGTLASARFLLDQPQTQTNFKFRTGNGIVIETLIEADNIFLSYPPYNLQHFLPTKELTEGLGLEKFQVRGYSPELETLFIELESASILKNITPDYLALKNSSDRIKEVVIMSISDDPRFDFFLRSFCPWIGIDEDPVTGSVHSLLGPFWHNRTGKQSMKAYQASKRGGEVLLRVYEDRVEIGGESVIVFKGEMIL